jgi:pyruvate ferredoxin oxidoreductase delta subunit
MSNDNVKVKGMVVSDRSARGGEYVGNWRVYRPEIDNKKCAVCFLCQMYCPEAAIRADEQNQPKIDMRFCKGCGICANECLQGAITMSKEEE